MIPQLLTQLAKPNQSLSATRILHALVIKHGLSLDPFYPTKILRFYAINGDLVSARNLFDRSSHRSVYLWNAVIRAYAQARKFHDALDMFTCLLSSETQPDNYTFSCIVLLCGQRFNLEMLRVVHGQVVSFGLGSDFICCSAFVRCYSMFGLVNEARCVFDQIEVPDLVLWNAMISGYGSVGEWRKVMELFNTMQWMGVRPDGYTIVGLVTGLVDPSLMRVGETVHGFCIKCGLVSNDHVGSGLVKMYSTWKNMELAFRVFDTLVLPDLVTWTALITGFCQVGDHVNALVFFQELVMKGEQADCVLLASVIAACAHLASIRPGAEIHGYAIRHGCSTEVVVSSALIDMYSKCGFLEVGIKVFKAMPRRNIVSYNTLILSLGLYGRAPEAIRMFKEILETGLKPDELTFVGLLCACCHSGLVHEGREYFRRMRSEFRIETKTEHYVYMVKLLGMDRKLEEAYELIKSLPEPVNSGIWGALLACCEPRKDHMMMAAIAEHLFGNRYSGDHGYSVMLSNLLASEERWYDVKALRGENGWAKGKVPGISWIGETKHSTG